MSVLSEADKAFYEDNGYVIVHDAVPEENLRATIAAIFDFLGMDPSNPDDWYRPPHRTGGMVEMYQHPSMWNNRQHPRVHQAFAESMGTERLWVTIDRVSMKPPADQKYPAYDNKGFTHLDANVDAIRAGEDPPRGVQGVLCLTDTTADMGGFRCVPGFHKTAVEWIRSHAPGQKLDFESLPAIPIPGKAGDLLIWHRLLAHGNGHNTSNRPRLAQYISMFPARENDEPGRRRRIEMWQTRTPPEATWVVGDERRWEQTHGTTATLTPLGRKLLGIDLWE